MSVNIILIGGIGNQLFQVACAYSYSKKHGKKLHIMNESLRGDYSDSILKNFKCYYSNFKSRNLTKYTEAGPLKYDKIPRIDNVLLSGYFQSEKYFRKYKEDIKNLIKTESTDEFKAKYNFDINSTVIIHARRTDYIEHANFHGPLKINYYINSIKLMKEKLNKDKLTFLLISDDNNFLKYLQENISDLRGSIIINDNDIKTFQLMYQMKYFIIAANFVFSVGLAGRGLFGMIQRDPLFSRGNEWSTLMWIFGLVTLFLIPLEICVIKPRRRD